MASGPPMEPPIVAPSGSALATASVPRAAGAGLVLDHEALAELLLQPVGDQPCHHVGRRPGTERHDDPDGQSCAAAGASASSDAATAIVRFVFIRLSCILR